jgi:hypothetical protein
MLDGIQVSVINPGGFKGGSNHWTVCSDDLTMYEEPVSGVGRQLNDQVAALELQTQQIALVPVGWVARGQNAVGAV